MASDYDSGTTFQTYVPKNDELHDYMVARAAEADSEAAAFRQLIREGREARQRRRYEQSTYDVELSVPAYVARSIAHRLWHAAELASSDTHVGQETRFLSRRLAQEIDDVAPFDSVDIVLSEFEARAIHNRLWELHEALDEDDHRGIEASILANAIAETMATRDGRREADMATDPIRVN